MLNAGRFGNIGRWILRVFVGVLIVGVFVGLGIAYFLYSVITKGPIQ